MYPIGPVANSVGCGDANEIKLARLERARCHDDELTRLRLDGAPKRACKPFLRLDDLSEVRVEGELELNGERSYARGTLYLI